MELLSSSQALSRRPRIMLSVAQPALRRRVADLLRMRYEVDEAASGQADPFVDAIVADREGACAPRDRQRAVPLILLARRGAALPPHDALHELPVRAHELLERVEIQLEMSRLKRLAAQRERLLAEEAGSAKRRLAFIAESSRLLTDAADPDAMLQQIAAIAVPSLAQWCAVDVLSRGTLKRVAAWHEAAFKTALLQRLAHRFLPLADRRHPVSRVLETGRTEFAPDVQVDFARRIAQSEEHFAMLRELDIASYICAPLTSGGKVVGVVSLGSDSTWRGFSRADVLVAEDLAARASAALDRARLYEGAQKELAERRRVEQELRLQQEHEHLILNTVDAMIWYKDGENRVLRLNRAAAEWVGRPVDELEGKRCEEIFPLDRALEYYVHDRRVMSSGQPYRDLERVADAQGRERWHRRDTIPYRDAAGNVKGVIVFAVDVTEQKLVEDMLRSNEAAQREFVANVSHEFQTPVAAIKGFAETLRLGAWRQAQDRERFLEIIESNADRLTRLVEDLLTLSALKETPVAGSPVDLRATALECAETLTAAAREAELSLSVSVPGGLMVLCDRLHLWQIIENLLSNAIRFNRPLGTVRVRGERRGDSIWLSVEDTGIGIERGHLPRIFDRFFRVEKGATPGRLGLGLHIVKRLVEAHRGRVWAESEFGAGSVFYVELPAADCRLGDVRARGAQPGSSLSPASMKRRAKDSGAGDAREAEGSLFI